MLNVVMLSIVILNVVMLSYYAECRNAECHCHECRYAECCGANVKYRRGAGPRHVAIDASRGVAFVVHELKSIVLTFNIDPESGQLDLKGAVDLLVSM